jgi:drug/metabolite transporter (DMT)-like permease
MAALPGEALPCGFPALKLRPTLKDSRLPFPMSPVFKAALWMAGWLAATLAMTLAGREVGRDVPVFVLMLLRSTLAVVVLIPFVLTTGGFTGRTQKFRVHVIRNIIHYGAQYAWFSALVLIPLAQVISIEFTAPVWVAILAFGFLGEKLTFAKIAAIVLGFAGIIAIVRPGAATIDSGHIFALSSALGFAVSITLTKFLTRTDSPLTIIFYMFVIQTVIGFAPAMMVWEWPEPRNWIWVGVLGIAGTFSHYCLSSALQLADTMIVMPMDFLRVPATAVLGYWLYGEGMGLFAIIEQL